PQIWFPERADEVSSPAPRGTGECPLTAEEAGNGPGIQPCARRSRRGDGRPGCSCGAVVRMGRPEGAGNARGKTRRCQTLACPGPAAALRFAPAVRPCQTPPRIPDPFRQGGSAL